MAHGKEGDGQAGAKEDDEVEGQLVPESGKRVMLKYNLAPETIHEEKSKL